MSVKDAVASDAAQAGHLLSQLTVEEKASLTVGKDFWTTRPVDRLGIPSIWLSDGPTGVRKAPESSTIGLGDSVPATCFPTESALAASWDTTLLREVGAAIGAECQALGVQVLLAPGVNLKRSPLGGRNLEYYSEDPVLSGRLAAAFIQGVQSQGVGTCLKHFVANEQETGRMFGDSVIDERTLRELYLRPFQIAIRDARPWSIMAAYNLVNGTYCTENRFLLHDVLKQEWGYDGIVMSDWMAINDRVSALQAGCHLQMPGGPQVDEVVEAVRSGRLDESRLDEIVAELLAAILDADSARRPETTVDYSAHHTLARRAAAESVTLLKNDGNLLPLDPERLPAIAIIGAFARSPRYQGLGSSQVVPTRVDTAHDELVRLAGPDSRFTYAPGYATGDEPDEGLIREAQNAASQAETALVFVGLPDSAESEGGDRSQMALPRSHEALVEAVLAVQPNTVVVLTNGSAVSMPWVDRVPAIVEGWLAGQAGGGAIADVLLGRVNPSGKVAETFPVCLEDTPGSHDFPGDPSCSLYGERLWLGYRWYDARRIEPLFPFGHGLSYTTFEYADLAVDGAVLAPGDTLTVTLTVRNTGTRAGQEVVQLYVHHSESRVHRPERELKAFDKVALEPGEAREVRFDLQADDFAYYDTQSGWSTNGGTAGLLAGASSRDIRLQTEITLEAWTSRPRPLGRLTPIGEWLRDPAGGPLLMARLAPLQARMQWIGGEHSSSQMQAFAAQLPVCKLILFGAFTEADLAGMIEQANAARSTSP